MTEAQSYIDPFKETITIEITFSKKEWERLTEHLTEEHIKTMIKEHGLEALFLALEEFQNRSQNQ